MSRIKILIADDHAIMRDGIKALLSSCDDFEIIGEAANGREAIEQAQKLDPDVIIMDLAMPIMDGIEATRRIKKKRYNTKILVLTQYDTRDHILSVLKLGADGFLPKIAVSSDLISAIRSINSGGSFLYPSAAAVLIEGYLHQPQNKDPYDNLTAREREVLKLIAEGHTSYEIAQILVLSIKTVQVYRSKLMQKLELDNYSELVKFAVRKGLIVSDT